MLGAHLKAGRFFIEPSDAVSFGSLHQNAYAVTGTGDLDLDVEANRTSLLTNAARLALGYTIGGGDSNLQLALRGSYLSQLTHVTPSVTASFAATGTPFTITSLPFANGQAQFGASVTYSSGSFAVRLAADRAQAAGGYGDTEAPVTVRVKL